ncbi:MAG: T9SS type A sorting domain-containing protein [Saprospiraceae bacterium]|nr:T9SS type A sorting domain-containing protein [Saprospiraceae bacterium]
MKHLLILLACGLIWPAGQLLAQTVPALFAEVDNPVLDAQQSNYLRVITAEPTAVSFRLVTVNSAALEQSDRLRIERLDEYGDIYLHRTNLVRRSGNNFSWFGSVDGYRIAGANLVVDKGYVHATIRFDDGLFTLAPLGKGLHVLVRRAYDKYPEEGCRKLHLEQQAPLPTVPEPSQKANERSNADNNGGGGCAIRLLVAFTDDVAAAHLNPRGEIQLATDNYNASNQNSGLDHQVELARVIEVAYAESGDDKTDRDRFRNTADGIMDEIHPLRDLYDADMCCLITETLDGCGLAAGIGSTYASAFQVTKFSCAADNLTFAHEFGHLLNARHDTFVDATAGTNHGLVNVANAWRTLMSYNDECDCSDETSPCPDGDDRATPGSPGCTRIQFWSNPNVSNLGDPTGTNDRCNNAAAVNAFDNTVDAFEGLDMNKILSAPEMVAAEEEANLSARQTVENNSGVAIDYLGGSKGCYQAGSSVTLRPGFWARNGSDYRAFIDVCSSTLPLAGGADERSEHLTAAALLEAVPNPVVDELRLVYQSAGTDVAAVRLGLYTAGGRLVTTPVLQGDAGIFRATCDVAALPAGVYYLLLEDGARAQTLKIVKVDR